MPDVLDRARTPLLTLLTAEALDRDYQAAADKRDGDAPRARRGRWAVVAVAALFAMLVTVAAVQTSRNADVDDASRAALIERIENRRERVQTLQADLARLRQSNAEAEEDLALLGDAVATVENRRLRLATYAGFAPAVGPGVRITVDNPDFIDPVNRLRDSDLAMLVDALWAVGAEAISINGQRLTARSGIRNSGIPIEVNSVGIAPPYTVLAIGNVDRMAADLVLSDPGQDFLAIAGQYGYSYEVDNVAELHLPAAPARLLRLRSATDASVKDPVQEGGRS